MTRQSFYVKVACTKGKILESTGTKQEQLKAYHDWKQTIQSCVDCELSNFRTNVVVDSGNPGSRWAIIGEGPGATEDQQGEAFVGVSGQLLRRLYNEKELEHETLPVIFNVIRCRPPQNVFPGVSVARKCQVHTKAQLDLLRPEIVVLTGRQAARWVLFSGKETLMKDVLGKYYWSAEFPFVKYFVCYYHPAYLLRKHGEERQQLEDGFVQIFEQIKKDLNRPEIPMRGKPIKSTKQPIKSLF